MTTPIILTRPYVGAESAEKERNLIIDFLRKQAASYYQAYELYKQNGNMEDANMQAHRAQALDWETDRIENGDHLRSQPKVPGPYSGT